jgi:hypothetical protein
MTVEDKVQKIKEAQDTFLSNIDALIVHYRSEIRKIMKGVDERKIAAIKKELGI